MKSPKPARRTYRMKARAELAAVTRDRILGAAEAAFGEEAYDEVSLSRIAEAADVTVKTVLRHFGSKEDLLDAGIERGLEEVRRDRWEAPVGDVAGAIQNLAEHYEAWGDRSVHFLAQERRIPAMARLTESGRALHHRWVERSFGPWLDRARAGAERTRLRARLIAVTDVYVWKIMRRDLGLGPKQTERALRELAEAVLGAREESP